MNFTNAQGQRIDDAIGGMELYWSVSYANTKIHAVITKIFIISYVLEEFKNGEHKGMMDRLLK